MSSPATPGFTIYLLPPMHIIRLVALALILATAFFAQVLFDRGSLAQFFPPWLLERVPFLAQASLWLAEDLHTLGLWLYGLAALGFGLLAPAWADAPALAPAIAGGSRRSTWLAAGGVVAALACAAALAAGVPEQTWLLLLWAGALLAFGAGVLLSTRGSTGAPVRVNTGRSRHRNRDWLVTAVVFAAATLLLTWGWTALPVRIDAAVARAGLYGMEQLANARLLLLTPGATGAPGLAYLLPALAIRLAGDTLAGTQWVGLLAALGTMAATLLLGGELFRRHRADGTDDNRQGMALVAAALTGANVAVLHFARMSPYLLATAAGVLGAWCLLRGLRNGSRLALAGGGMLAAGALLLDRSGILFAPVLLAWWAGAWLLLRPAPGGSDSRMAGFLWWGGGLLVVLAPMAGYWLGHPGTWSAYLHGTQLYGLNTASLPVADLWANLRTTAAAFFWAADAGRAFGYPGHFLDSLTAPLFVLAIGALLFNLDRPVGWQLLTWLGVGVVVASLASLAAPDSAMLLPLAPAAALAVSFALDRIRATWLAPAPRGDLSAIRLMAGGILVAAALLVWVGYYGYARNGGDAVSYVGRGLRTASPAAEAILVTTLSPSIDLADPVVQFGANGQPAITATPAQLPATLPGGTLVLVLPQEQALLAEVRSRYPGGEVEVLRDLRANPRLITYRLP